MNAEAECLEGWLLRASPRGDSRTQRELVTRARKGDPSAFDEIVRRHEKRVYNLAYRMLRQREDAEDVTQEAFLKAFDSLPRLREKAALEAWICRIAANLCLSKLRSRAYRSEAPVDPRAITAGGKGAVEEGSQESIGQVREAIAQLPPKYRLAVVAYYLEGRSYKEAAHLMGVPVLTLKTRLYRARKMLRDMLSEGSVSREETSP